MSETYQIEQHQQQMAALSGRNFRLRHLLLNAAYGITLLCVIACFKATTTTSDVAASTANGTEPLDIFITVKTSRRFHRSRLPDILDTWFTLAPNNIYFVTDADDPEVFAMTGGHVINSKCPATHSRQALCCKLSVEYTLYLNSNKSWFCHFDDDNYVNVPQLSRALSAFDPSLGWYIGKSSTSHPIELTYKENGFAEKMSFWFATGGAGFCLSRPLALKIAPLAANGRLVDVGDKIRLPDDVTLGFIIERSGAGNLTVVDSFHSHLESMRAISVAKLSSQVSLSAGGYNARRKNVVMVEELFDESEDRNRFKSLHCFLFPTAGICSTGSKRRRR